MRALLGSQTKIGSFEKKFDFLASFFVADLKRGYFQLVKVQNTMSCKYNDTNKEINHFCISFVFLSLIEKKAKK
ncbi:hypothetical protein STRINF_01876 [Streptococcus infantarius subsp. infantarius ATCC BAA-102]|uniref:Uncharacterized protein n=1 Tax=Streptococcus infantarius subsp. infantarius ATCC BAA-102 TaxID=471872 RepID=A0ABM9XCI9_9STRE|nr:hypothetical protein STRINF_01876 [Streptococcus infantarius subsp. infantarius ATCC BAA-102]